jgi:hypothetical protein
MDVPNPLDVSDLGFLVALLLTASSISFALLMAFVNQTTMRHYRWRVGILVVAFAGFGLAANLYYQADRYARGADMRFAAGTLNGTWSLVDLGPAPAGSCPRPVRLRVQDKTLFELSGDVLFKYDLVVFGGSRSQIFAVDDARKTKVLYAPKGADGLVKTTYIDGQEPGESTLARCS